MNKNQWTDWCKKFLATEQTPMSKEITEIFVICFQNEKDPGFPGEKFEESFLMQVFMSRANYFDLNCSKAVATFISSLAENPGSIVMWVHALLYLQITESVSNITMEYLTEKFPLGFPSEDRLHNLWDAQKGYNMGEKFDNGLDACTTGTFSLNI